MKDIVTRLWSILDARARRKVPVAIALAFVVAGLDTLGVGLILPFISALTQPEHSGFLVKLREWLPGLDHAKLAPLMALALVVVFLVKNVVAFAITWWNYNFVLEVKADLATALFRRYIHAPFSWHLRMHSADAIRNMDAVYGVVGNILVPFVNCIVDVVLFVLIGIILMTSAPLASAVEIALIVVAMLVYHRMFRDRATMASKRTLTHFADTLKSIQESLGSIREVQIMGRADHLTAMYRHYAREMVQNQVTQNLLQVSPRFYLETVVILVVFSVFAIGTLNGSAAEGMSLLVLFAVAGIRLLPSLNRLLAASQQFRVGLPMLDLVYRDLAAANREPPPAERPEGASALPAGGGNLALKGVSFSYSAADQKVLDGIDLTIPHGRTIGIVGVSGAGKSTLLDLIAGLVTPTGGTIEVDGIDIATCRRAWQDRIGYVAQNVYLLDDSIRRNVAFGQPDHQIDEARVVEALRMVALDALVDGLPEGLETRLGERGVRLSGGQRQRLGLARALYIDPSVILLDEATSALDNETEARIHSVIAGLHGSRTVIIIAHRLNTVRDADQVVFLSQGRIADQGSFAELAGRNPEFKRLVQLAVV